MGGDEQVCPVCGQQVETVVRRHKTLGTYVPVWKPGPCRNPECSAYVEDTAETPEPPRATGHAPGTAPPPTPPAATPVAGNPRTAPPKEPTG